MTWFKVDDQFWGHPKQTALPKGAVCLWVRAGSWSANLLTNGFVPAHMVAMLGCSKGDAKALVTAELWEEVNGGYQFHDWNVYQPTREQVEEKREEEARRKAEWRRKKAAQRAASQARPEDVPMGHGGDKDVSPASVPDVSRSSRPDPTRPDPDSPNGESSVGVDNAPGGATPTPAKRSRKKPSTALPDGFTVTHSMRDWHRSKGVNDQDADRQTERFKANALAKDSRYANWEQAWRNWIDQAIDWGHVKAGPQLVASNGERNWTSADLDAILGVDYWRLPPYPAGMDADQGWEWEQRMKREHRAERIRQAEAKLTGAA